LQEAGIEVCTTVLAEEASRLNEAYIHFMRTGRPFVHLKMAMSLDGKIATRTGDSRWITGEEARARVHELRHQSDAIMVGGGTVRADNPLLTDRSAKKRRRPLARVVIDQCLHLTPDSHLARTTAEAPVIVFTRRESPAATIDALKSRNVEVISEDPQLVKILEALGEREIQSVLVEGGATLAGLLLDAGLINKVTFFIAPVIIGGKEAPSAIAGAGAEKIPDAVRLERVEMRQHGCDMEVTGYPIRG
jgi:diaminohydroxyphosphoribosylaminopyrimidine deaminase/5-amino-6-(5-phosphoribosylamino)uracil reductase